MMILLVSMSLGSGSINYGQATTARRTPSSNSDVKMCIRFFSGVFINKFTYSYRFRGPNISTLNAGGVELLPSNPRACVMICRPGSGQRINGKPNTFFIEHSDAFPPILSSVFYKRIFSTFCFFRKHTFICRQPQFSGGSSVNCLELRRLWDRSLCSKYWGDSWFRSPLERPLGPFCGSRSPAECQSRLGETDRPKNRVTPLFFFSPSF